MNDRDSLERRLIAAYASQRIHYDAALDIVERAATQSDADPWADELQTALHAVAAIDRAMADDRTAWTQAGYSAGEALRTTLDALAERIRRLAERIDLRINDVTARRDQILPEVTSLLRQRQMHMAYASHAS